MRNLTSKEISTVGGGRDYGYGLGGIGGPNPYLPFAPAGPAVGFGAPMIGPPAGSDPPSSGPASLTGDGSSLPDPGALIGLDDLDFELGDVPMNAGEEPSLDLEGDAGSGEQGMTVETLDPSAPSETTLDDSSGDIASADVSFDEPVTSLDA
jgi:hypothetical protein